MLTLMNDIFVLSMCHFMGDYVLQNDYIAKNKEQDTYLLFVHSTLYCLPFMTVFGYDYRIYILLLSHLAIDMAKTRKIISIKTDQILHILFIVTLYSSVIMWR